MNTEENLKVITVIRMVGEALDYCQSWELMNSYGQKLQTLVFYYSNPVDIVIWRVKADFFKEHLKPLFEAAEFKNKFPKQENRIANGL